MPRVAVGQWKGQDHPVPDYDSYLARLYMDAGWIWDVVSVALIVLSFVSNFFGDDCGRFMVVHCLTF